MKPSKRLFVCVKLVTNRSVSHLRPSGFTLIEVMVYGVVFAFFLLLVTQVFLAIKSTSANTRAIVSLQENYARVFSDLSATLRQADNVLAPGVGSTAPSLSLNSGSILYRIEDGVLKKVIAGSSVDLTDARVSVVNPVFARFETADHKPSVRITFTVESNYLFPGERKVSEEFQTAFTLR